MKTQLTPEEHAALPYHARLFAVEFRDPVGIVYSEPVPEHVAQALRDLLHYAASGQPPECRVVRGIEVRPLLADVAPAAIAEKLQRTAPEHRFQLNIAGRLVHLVRWPLQELAALQLAAQQLRAEQLASAGEDQPPGDDIVFEPTEPTAASGGTLAEGGDTVSPDAGPPPAAQVSPPATWWQRLLDRLFPPDREERDGGVG